MLNTYQAELHENRINWIDQIPKEISKGYIYKVKIQILEREEKQSKNDLVEFFQNSPMNEIELNLGRAKYTSREIDYEIALKWGEIDAKSELSGRKMPVIDGLIAASALVNNLTVVTRNIKDIKKSGCKILNPWKK